MIAGAAYLRTMHDRYGWPDALAAYHAGIGRFEKYLASGRPLPKLTTSAFALDASELAARASSRS